MGQASTSRVQLRYMKEATFGVTPVTGNGRKLRMVGESLNYDLTKDASKEIRADRQVAGATTVDAQAAGGVNFHMQYAEYDQLIEGALMSTFTAFGTNGVGATFTMTATTTTITASVATSGSSIFTSLQPGQWFRLTAPSDPNDGLWLRNSLSVAATTTVITLDASTPAVAAVGVANCKLATSRLTNGITEASFSMEKEFADVVQFFTYTGMEVSKMTVNFAAAALTDGSFDFMGKKAVRNTATQMPGTVTASNTYEIQNGVRGIGQLWEGTVPLSGTYVKTLTLVVDNSLRGQKALGNLGNVGIGAGDFKGTGTMEVYFASGTQYDKFLNDTYTQIIVACQDSSGYGYVLTAPRVLLTKAKLVAGGKNQDAMLQFDIEFFSDDANAAAALQKTLFIDRLGPAVP